MRLKDINLLDLLINKTVEIAIETDVLKCHTIIVDATHTKARYNQKSAKEILMDRSKKLRQAVYAIDASLKGEFPTKPTSNELKHRHGYNISKILGSCWYANARSRRDIRGEFEKNIKT
ncbi:hypothetical protein GCM10012290_19970 [Halolactibacillus alkaliphilus]|nr:hypothetical protein GCM10012290_19970 [Halolactibacillus alkaliphilus]